MQTCFSLLECILNGIAWKYLHKNDINQLSERQRKLLDDSSNATIREKIEKYPKIVFAAELTSPGKQYILDIAKPFRDSLMHPSLSMPLNALVVTASLINYTH